MARGCPNCGGHAFEFDPARGDSVCLECGCVTEENTIVAEVGFTETSSGAAAVQGTFIGNNQVGARVVGPHGRTSGFESSELTIQRGLALLRNYQHPLNLPDNVILVAERHFKLAHEFKFTKGRHIEHVMAVCLYMGCKYHKTSHMLIDFADILRVNIFTLGSTYLKWLRVSHWPEKDIVEPSIFIARFIALLEFGDDSYKVASDAVRIAARFKQDWIHEGRRTAGICGAAIYLASQMNNYRRSIQEITQVVKIADVTILKRLEEFSVTSSAQLTVHDFKTTDAPTEAAMPPSWTRAREKEKEQVEGGRERRGRKRKRGQEEPDEVYEVESAALTEGISLPVVLFSPSQGTRHLNRGIPIDPQLLGDGILKDVVEPQPPKASGSVLRPTALLSMQSTSTSGARSPAPELEPDPETAQEIENLLQSERGQDAARIAQLAIVSREAFQHSVPQPVSQSEAGEEFTMEEGERGTGASSEPEDRLDNLDEVELDAFLCSPEEATQRERIWTEFNLDYLRKLAARRYKDQTGEDLKPKKKRQKKPKEFVPGQTAAESVKAMMSGSKKFSKKINYDNIDVLFPEQHSMKTAESDYGMDEDEKSDEEDKADDTDKHGFVVSRLIAKEREGGEGEEMHFDDGFEQEV